MRSARAEEPPIARTIRFPRRLRTRIDEDAERCGRSFEAHVLAILRHHYGEDVDIAPTPDLVLRLARSSLAGLKPNEQKALLRRFTEDE